MLTFKKVSFFYEEERPAISDIDITINPGECVLFCGRSGCGKTTIMRLVNGLIPHYYNGHLDGHVLFQGKKITEYRSYDLALKIGTVFQNPKNQFFNTETSSELVYGLTNAGVEYKELVRILNQSVADLGLAHLLGRSILTLSGGEKQKIAFGSAYTLNPDVYVLDEPTSNLDLSGIQQLVQYLKYIKSRNKTIIIAEHRLYYLKDIVDKIYYMEDGVICRDFCFAELAGMQKQERIHLGLRSLSLDEMVFPQVKQHMQPTLEVRNLQCRYSNNIVLEDLNFNAADHEIIGIVGKNGEGKTTLLRTLCGLHKNFSADILLNGKKTTRKILQKNAFMVMQDVNNQLFANSVYTECSVGQGSGGDGDGEKKIKAVLTAVNLYECRKRHPNTLSGGEKQRLTVALTMLFNKKIVIFDEPTSGLDYENMDSISNLIKELSRKACIIFIVSHDFEMIEKTCTRLIYLKNKKIAEDLFFDKNNEAKIENIIRPTIKYSKYN